MWKIKLSPVACNKVLSECRVQGDVLYINGEDYDFSQLEEGETLVNMSTITYDETGKPQEVPGAIDNFFIQGDIERKDGYIYLTIITPVFSRSSYESRFPYESTNGVVTIEKDGPVPIPDNTPVEDSSPIDAQALEALFNSGGAFNQLLSQAKASGADSIRIDGSPEAIAATVKELSKA